MMFPIRQPLKSYASAYRGDVPLRPVTTRLPVEVAQELAEEEERSYVIDPVPSVMRVAKKTRKRKVPLLPLSKASLQEKRDDELVALVNARRPSLLLRESSGRLLPDRDPTGPLNRASCGQTPRDLLTSWAGMKTHRPEDMPGYAERTPSQRNLYANSAFLSPLDRGNRSKMSANGNFLVNARKENMNIGAAPTEKRLYSASFERKAREDRVGLQEDIPSEAYKRVSHLATPRDTARITRQPSAENPARSPVRASSSAEDGKLPNPSQSTAKKNQPQRSMRDLQFETDNAFAPYDERMQKARQQHEAKRKEMVVGPQADWILMPGETPPDDRRNFSQVGMLPPPSLVDETVKQIKRVFRWCFESPADAFSFFDIGGHYKLSITWLQRGFYRMNMHELWRCPHPDCCRFVCPLPDDHEQHSYVLMDDRMCLAIMRKAHVVENTFWKHDFVKFFDFGKDHHLVQLPTCVDVVSTSATTPRMNALLNAQAESGNKIARSSITKQRIINKGRDWGIREDWRRYARWLGGGNAWRLLHKQCSQLYAQREKRKAIFHQLCEDIRMMTLGDRKMNSKQVGKGEKKLERCVQLVKKTEMRILGTLEKYSLHLIIPKAIEEANGRKVLAVAPDLSNLLEVMLDLVEALMSLSPEERSQILLQKENPEGDVEGLSLNDSGEGLSLLGGTVAESSEEDEPVSRCASSEAVSSWHDAGPEGEAHAHQQEQGQVQGHEQGRKTAAAADDGHAPADAQDDRDAQADAHGRGSGSGCDDGAQVVPRDAEGDAHESQAGVEEDHRDARGGHGEAAPAHESGRAVVI